MDSQGLKSEPSDRAHTSPSSRQDSADQPVLVAIDLASSSEGAVIWACNHASHIGAPVVILHVVHDPSDSPGYYRSSDGDLLEPMADAAGRTLRAFLNRLEQDHPELEKLGNATTICVSGLPAQQILDAAKAQQAQLLVLGGRQRDTLRRFMHGSTADQVLRHAEIPVTVVKEYN